MKRKEPKQMNWQAVISEHLLESHEPEEWLRYGAALLQTLEPGEGSAKQLQQSALAFLQAKKEGATQEQIVDALRQSANLSLKEALSTTRSNKAKTQSHASSGN